MSECTAEHRVEDARIELDAFQRREWVWDCCGLRAPVATIQRRPKDRRGVKTADGVDPDDLGLY